MEYDYEEMVCDFKKYARNIFKQINKGQICSFFNLMI